MPKSSSPAIGVRSRPVGVLAAAIVLGMIGLAVGPGRSACGADADDLAGRVVDPAGAAVAGAEVWAIGGVWDHPRALTKATADDRGRFVLAGAWKPRGPEEGRTLSVLARAPDGRIGWKSHVWAQSPDVADLRIAVAPVGEVRGRIHDHEGRPVAGAGVVPTIISRPDAENRGLDYIGIPADLAGPFRGTTGADGSFVLGGIPRDTEVGAKIAAPGFGEPRVSWKTSKPVAIVLDGRLGRVEGTFRPADARGLTGKLKVPLRREMPPEKADVPYRMMVYRTATPDADGRFRFDDLPPGTYEIDPASGEGALVETQAVPKIEVGPGAVARVEVPLERLLAITGRVVDSRTGRGIAGVEVRSGRIDRNTYYYTGRARTDAEGRYTIAGKRGKVQMSLGSVPRDHLGLLDSRRPSLDVEGDREWPEMKLDPAVVLDGVVVDASGKPVEGAEVHVLPPDTQGVFSSPPPARTGPDGTFRFEQIDPDDTLPVWARTKEATTDGMVVIKPGDLKGKPLRLTIDPRFAFRIRGRVTDRAGKRLAGARAVVWWYRSYKSEKDSRGMGIGSTFDAQTLDSSGWFYFRGLWPGDRYKVVIEAPGGGKAEPPELTGKAGETRDLGTIVMAGAGGHIAGRVVGSDGKPIAGATVFNRGDGPRPLRVQTDAAGRFRLDGLFPDTRYAFARKDGYRFAGVMVEGGGDGTVITMYRDDEAPPAWKPAAAPTPEAQRALARAVLLRIWERFGEKADQNGAERCIPAMARIDFDLAMQWSAERKNRLQAEARIAAAGELAATDAPGAIALLALVEPLNRQFTLHDLAKRFAETDPARALLFAEEAVVQARGLGQPPRTYTLAPAGEMLVRLGRVEAGRKAIEQAAADAARMGVAGMEGYARGLAARALAPFDADRALKLVAPFTGKDEKERYTGFVAGALAEVNTDRALALVDTISAESTLPDNVRTEIAYRVAARDPERAIRIAEGMKSYAAEKTRIDAMAWLAVAIAPRDPARAAALIDRALSEPVDRPQLYRSWIHFGGGTRAAAEIAACARHSGYPDMGSVVLRVMATRVGLGEQQAHDPALEIRSATMAAVPLALVDPGAARVLLRQIEARSGLDPVELAEVAGDDWLRAWGLVDLEKAAALVEAQLAAIEKDRNPSLRGNHGSPIFKMLDMLIDSPDRREAEVFHVVGPSWRPEFQY